VTPTHAGITKQPLLLGKIHTPDCLGSPGRFAFGHRRIESSFTPVITISAMMQSVKAVITVGNCLALQRYEVRRQLAFRLFTDRMIEGLFKGTEFSGIERQH
jgi:hypothetical protein